LETKNNKLTFNKLKSNFRIVYGDLDAAKQIREVSYYPKETNGYSDRQPQFDAERKRLYFTFDKPVGYGGTDIYYVQMNAEGVASEAVNLGEKVNSIANEMFPSVSVNQLYFSSDLFLGNGGLDVYSSKINGSGFEYPIALGSSINNTVDDFAYHVIDNDSGINKGYLSSNRDGGKGSDDSYSFTTSEIVKEIEISRFTRLKENKSIILPETKLIISTIHGATIDTLITNKLGLHILLTADKNYLFKAEKNGFMDEISRLMLSGVDKSLTTVKDLYLTKIMQINIPTETIYFDLDDARISLTAETQL
jgi:hypothetical protein